MCEQLHSESIVIRDKLWFTDLHWFLVDSVRSPTELVQGCVGVLSVNHDDISTASRRDHLYIKRAKVKLQIHNAVWLK